MKNMAEKQIIRKTIRDLRKAVKPEEKRAWDEALKDQFWRFSPFVRAVNESGCVYAYLDFGNEAGTGPLLERFWEMGIKTAVPRVEGELLRFYYIRHWDEAEPGTMGILEPKDGLMQAGCPDCLVLVPGVAFDRRGRRLGYGGGYYDRFLTREPGHFTVGLAYQFQVLETILTDPWDQGVEYLLTPGETLASEKRQEG